MIKISLISSAMASIARALPQIFLMPFVFRSIGAAGTGLYSLSMLIPNSINRLEMSLQSGGIRILSSAYAEEDDGSDLLGVLIAESIVMCILVVVGLGIGVHLLKDSLLQDLSRLSIASIYGLVIAGVLSSPYLVFLKANRMHWAISMITTIGTYFTIAGTLAIILAGSRNVNTIIFAANLVSIVVYAALVVVTFRKGFIPRPIISDRSRSLFRELKFYAATNLSSFLCITISTIGIRLLLAAQGGVADVGYFSIAITPSLFCVSLTSAGLGVVMPTAASMLARGEVSELENLYKKLCRFLIWGSGLLAIGLGVNMWWIMGSMYGGNTNSLVISASIALLNGVAYDSVSDVTIGVLRGAGRDKRVTVSRFISLIVIPGLMFYGLRSLGIDSLTSAVAAILLGKVAGTILLMAALSESSRFRLPTEMVSLLATSLFGGTCMIWLRGYQEITFKTITISCVISVIAMSALCGVLIFSEIGARRMHKHPLH